MGYQIRRLFMRYLAGVFVFATFTGATSIAVAQQPQVSHATVTAKSADRGLAAEIDALKSEREPVWVGYSIPVVEKFSHGWDSGRVAYLEGTRPSEDEGESSARPSFDHALVLMRVASGAVEKIRVESPDRELDGGGLGFVWLNNIALDDSLKTLVSLVKQNTNKRLVDGGVMAISIHRTPAATQELIALASPQNDRGLREQAVFWLANERGHDGFIAIQRMAREDEDAAFREKLVFDLTITKDPDAVKELVRMAHEDSAPGVRKQAQFWMAQKGGKMVAGDLQNMAQNDPEAQIRKSAVFAISRLPGDEATTQLIQLAKTGKDPAVRKQAVFWLGQSKDPRVLDYLTELIEH
jgi:HEAT repeats